VAHLRTAARVLCLLTYQQDRSGFLLSKGVVPLLASLLPKTGGCRGPQWRSARFSRIFALPLLPAASAAIKLCRRPFL
jgi:hypothetical protein